MRIEDVFEWAKRYLTLVMPPSSKFGSGYRQSATGNFCLAFSPPTGKLLVLPRNFDRYKQTLFQCKGIVLAENQPLAVSLSRHSAADDWQLMDFHVDWPAESCWGLSELPVKTNHICMISASHKFLVVYHDQEGEPYAVLKVPETTAVSRGIQAEATTLELLSTRAPGIAPRLLALGSASYPDSGTPFRYSLQQFIVGNQPRKLTRRDAGQYLHRLITDKPPVSMRQIAAGLESQVVDLPLKGESRDRLRKILNTVNCATALPLSLYHGDFKLENLVIGADDRLVAIDWEFSNRLMPACFDLIRLLLSSPYNSPAVRDFESMYRSRMESLQNLANSVYPQNTPPLEQLLALQFCQHFVDRVTGFGGVVNPNMKRLEDLLQTSWIA